MILATTSVKDLDHFLEIYGTKGADKRISHGCKGSVVYRDPVEEDRVWAVFDWDEEGWTAFATDPETPASCRRPATWAAPPWASSSAPSRAESRCRGYCTMADPPRRVNFFDGLLLTAADLAAEQEYHRGMRYLHNRLHGYGTVSGLEVTVARGRVRVTPGAGHRRPGARDRRHGPVDPAPRAARERPRWVRDVGHRVAARSPEPRCRATTAPSSSLAGSSNPSWCSRPGGGAAPEGLVLARLTRTDGGKVEVDTSRRRPLGPAPARPVLIRSVSPPGRPRACRRGRRRTPWPPLRPRSP